MNTTAVHILRKFFILIIMAAGLFNPIAKAQEVQLWLDAYAIKSFGKTKAFEYEGNIGYDKLLQPKVGQTYILITPLHGNQRRAGISWKVVLKCTSPMIPKDRK